MTEQTDTPFFFDTADTDAIKKIWDTLGKRIDSANVLGITTNPNALSKVGCNTLAQFEELVPRMCETIKEIRGDAAPGIVYVQGPNSLMTEDETLKWAEYVNQFNTDTHSIGLKIPHFSYLIGLTDHPTLQQLYLNVTGVADAATIIKALLNPNIFFASIIPGRMQEQGTIDVEDQLKYLAHQKLHPHQNIIAGSMRTIDGLKQSIHFDTIPTIGTRVWDIIEKDNLWGEFESYWSNRYWNSHDPAHPDADYMPRVSNSTEMVSREFFDGMDILGKDMYAEFQSKCM